MGMQRHASILIRARPIRSRFHACPRVPRASLALPSIIASDDIHRAFYLRKRRVGRPDRRGAWVGSSPGGAASRANVGALGRTGRTVFPPEETYGRGAQMANNPRRSNGSRRTALRNRLKHEGRPCWICRVMGRTGTIDYSLRFPHPYSFVVDELVPVSKYQLGGYTSPEACALDYKNLAAAHKCCNEWRGNRTVDEVLSIARKSNGDATPRVVRDVRPSRDWRNFKPARGDD